MRAAVMTAAGQPLSIEDVTPLELGPTEALVRIAASGVCHSDLLFQQGMGMAPPPSILGHEGAGVVEEVGRDVRAVRPGDRVVCSWVTSCGTCWFCSRGETHLCPAVVRVRTEEKFRRQDGSTASRMMGVGSFAEAAVVDERALVAVETDLPDEELAILGCGVTTGVGAVLNTAAVEPGATVAVFGCGGVGQSAIQGARIAGAAAVIAVDPVELKRTTALALGATAAVDPAAGDVAERIRELTHGRGVDYAFEVAGLEATLAPAHESLRSGGALVIVGVQSAATTFPFGPLEMFARATRVLGCMYGSTRMHRDVVRLVELAEAGRLDIAALVSRRIALDEVNDALQAIERGEVIRSVIVS